MRVLQLHSISNMHQHYYTGSDEKYNRLINFVKKIYVANGYEHKHEGIPNRMMIAIVNLLEKFVKRSNGGAFCDGLNGALL